MKNVKEKKVRLDSALVLRGLVSSRARGEALIGEGNIAVDGVVVKNKSFLVTKENILTLLKEDFQWVSRGALKLEHALNRWKVDPKGKAIIDIGASTGGFTEVLLSRGAKKVFALDVGHGQLAQKLCDDPRVINMEGKHINDAVLAEFKKPVDMIVVDVSFVSLEKVLPKAKELLRPGGILIALIKPQFEVGKKHIGKGVVSDPKLHSGVAMRIEQVINKLGFVVEGVIESPILGGSGNKEFLLYARFPE